MGYLASSIFYNTWINNNSYTYRKDIELMIQTARNLDVYLGCLFLMVVSDSYIQYTLDNRAVDARKVYSMRAYW